MKKQRIYQDMQRNGLASMTISQ